MPSDKIVVYPIIIEYSPDDTNYPYLVTIPDLDNVMTEGRTIEDAMAMAEECIGNWSFSHEVPESNYSLPFPGENETVTLVKVNISEFQRTHDEQNAYQTVTIPLYLYDLVQEQRVSISDVLTDALREKFSI